MKQKVNLLLFTALLLPALFAASAPGQTLIFLTPSTDVQARDTTFVEAVYEGRYGRAADGAFQTVGGMMVRGLTDNVEIGINYFYTRSGGEEASEFQPNIKWRFYSDADRKIAFSAGSIGYFPVTSDRADASAVLYLNGSKGITTPMPLRLTGGVYRALSSDPGFGTKTGVMLGVEKQLSSRVGLSADWFSGRNPVGFSGAAVTFSATETQVLTLGYFFGNSGRGNNGFSIGYSFTF